jgi:hypothetical protein
MPLNAPKFVKDHSRYCVIDVCTEISTSLSNTAFLDCFSVLSMSIGKNEDFKLACDKTLLFATQRTWRQHICYVVGFCRHLQTESLLCMLQILCMPTTDTHILGGMTTIFNNSYYNVTMRNVAVGLKYL